jgi:uncharacterized protein (DUF736 family)
MAYEQKPNSGVLFSNKVKKSPKAPDYQGDITIDTRLFKQEDGLIKVSLGGWKKTSSNGNTFLSLAASVPYQKDAPKQETHVDEDVDF